jgi:hypothetical protein
MRFILTLLVLFVFSSLTARAQDCPDECEIVVPKTITADSDCYDCHFLTIESNCEFDKFNISIYNRWGILLFESDNPEVKWSCSGVESGTFFWKIEFEFCNDEILEKEGFITVIN